MSLNGYHLGLIVDTKVEENIKDHPMIMYLQFDFNETVLPEKKIVIKTQLSYCESIFIR